MTRTIHVHAPCRLHFGMFGFGRSNGPQWGGVGVMIEPPAVDVTIVLAAEFSVSGQHTGRAGRFAQAAAREWQLAKLPLCQIEVSSPSEHMGLGVGTQLGLSVAAGLRKFLELPDLSAEALAASVRRGRRSAVGTHGFLQGGLIVDGGKEEGQQLGTLWERVAVPDAWRFVLIASRGERGLSGETESDAFARLPPVPGEVTQELWRLTEEEMLPAVKRGDSAAFGEAVYHFGRLSGECFTPVQGGPFATRETGRLVDAIRERGVAGVGQSSWGPTVFALAASDDEAQALVAWLREEGGVDESDIMIARPNNRGAKISQVNASGR